MMIVHSLEGTWESSASADWEEGRLLCDPAFWIGGLVSLVVWTALAAVFVLA